MVSKGLSDQIVCVVGLGYVGQPLAEEFSNHMRTIGFDIDIDKVNRIRSGKKTGLNCTSDPSKIQQADFVLICVPTPITKNKEPDLYPVKSAMEIVGKNLKKGATVVLESTVYPGVTEEIVIPILERYSGMKCGLDFKVGYSPERVNPGDKAHTLDKITKIVSGMDEETTMMLADLYAKVTNVYVVKDIRTAEAAKVIENIQRDINIALINELAMIFERLGLDTYAVLEAAGTKWNFMRLNPGLVGGHCIPVDPYYLVYKSLEVGYHPQMILGGRAINDSMPQHVAMMAIKGLNEVGKTISGSKVLLMGVTYKEDISDMRETPVKEMIKELKSFKVDLYGYDPHVEPERIKTFGIIPIQNLDGKFNFDCIIINVAHKEFKKISLDKLKSQMNSNPVLVDVRRIYDKKLSERSGIYYIGL